MNISFSRAGLDTHTTPVSRSIHCWFGSAQEIYLQYEKYKNYHSPNQKALLCYPFNTPTSMIPADEAAFIIFFICLSIQMISQLHVGHRTESLKAMQHT